MNKITILHTRIDKKTALDLEQNLNDNGITWISQYEIDSEVPLEHQISNALSTCDYAVCLLSQNLINSNQQTDENFQITVKQQVIPLYLDEKSREKNYLHDYDKNLNSYEQKEHLIKNLILLFIKKDELETYEKIQSTLKDNPFSKVRAEFFDASHLANTFFEPEREKYDVMISPKAVILEGGRGSGKTMILRSLAALAAIKRSNKSSFHESNLPYFGVYMRLDKGGFALASDSELENIPRYTANQLFLDDFNLQFTQIFLETIQDCVKDEKLSIPLDDENFVCNKILNVLKPDANLKTSTIDEILNFINEEKRNIRKFVGKILLHKDLEYNGCITSQETFKNICKLILEYVIKSNDVTVFLLLDEYENLLLSQQIIINSLIKISDKIVTLKIGTKFEGVYTRKTLFGEQDIQTPHDYSNIPLDYNLRNDHLRKQYEDLLVGICEKLLISKNYKQTDIKKLLKSSDELKITDDDLREQLQLMLEEKNQNISELNEKEINQKIAYYKDALIFRALNQKQFRKGKTYAGFDTFVLLSSGIIRQFLELSARSLYYAQEEGFGLSELEFIDPKFQTMAAHSVSAASLEKIAPGVEDLGIVIQRFVIDIGDIFRDRLLNDNNEPETIRIMTQEPRSSWSEKLKQVYQIGIRESIFQNIEEHDAMRPKQQNYARPTEFIINRIFTPVLEISFRARWRTSFSSKDLEDLLNGSKRIDAIKRIMPKRKSKKSLKNSGVQSLDKFSNSGDE